MTKESQTFYKLWQNRLRQTSFMMLCAFPGLLVLTRSGSEITLILIALMFLLASAIGGGWSWLKQPEIRILIILWIYMLAIAWITLVNPMESLKASLIWGRFILFYAALRFWLLQTANDLTRLYTFGLVFISLAMMDTALQYVTGTDILGRNLRGDRLTGPMSNPNIGNFLLKISLPMMGLMFYQITRHGKRWQRIYAAMFTMALIFLVLVSGERSIALLMLLAIGVAGIILFVFNPPLRRRVLFGGLSIATLLVIITATQNIVQHRGQFLIQQLSDFWNTTYGQLYMAVYRLWQEYPLFGIGVKQFREACPTIMDKFNIVYCDIHPHNLYLEWLVSTGIIGFALFMLAMAIIVCRLLRTISLNGRSSILAAFSCAGLVVLLFPLIVTQSQFSNWPGMIFWYSLALTASLPIMAQNKKI